MPALSATAVADVEVSVTSSVSFCASFEPQPAVRTAAARNINVAFMACAVCIAFLGRPGRRLWSGKWLRFGLGSSRRGYRCTDAQGSKERGHLALVEGETPSFPGFDLGVFAAGAAALARREHAGSEGILPSSRARRPRSQACSMGEQVGTKALFPLPEGSLAYLHEPFVEAAVPAWVRV